MEEKAIRKLSALDSQRIALFPYGLYINKAPSLQVYILVSCFLSGLRVQVHGQGSGVGVQSIMRNNSEADGQIKHNQSISSTDSARNVLIKQIDKLKFYFDKYNPVPSLNYLSAFY